MKTLFFLILFSNLFFAQSLNFNEINSKNVQILFDNSKKTDVTIPVNKTVILQRGDYNFAEVYTRSQHNDLLIAQTGDYNSTLMVNQNADKNLKSEIKIQGSNNHIDITGNNSISENMKINLVASDKMIFIRNY